MNGFSTEEDTRGTGHNQICCLIDGAYRCARPAGNASYSKRIQKTVQQRRLRLIRDDSVSPCTKFVSMHFTMLVLSKKKFCKILYDLLHLTCTANMTVEVEASAILVTFSVRFISYTFLSGKVTCSVVIIK